MTRFVVTASPVDDLDEHPPLLTCNVEAASTSDAVELATRLLHSKSPGLAVTSVTMLVWPENAVVLGDYAPDVESLVTLQSVPTDTTGGTSEH